MAQEMTASAQAMSDAIAKSGRLDVYGITFATGQATITPASDQVLSDVLAVLTAQRGLAAADRRAHRQRRRQGREPQAVERAGGGGGGVADRQGHRRRAASRSRVWATRSRSADNATEDGRARNRRVVLVKQ